MDDLDHDPHLNSISLEDFCNRAKRLLQNGAMNSFVRFVLTGKHGGCQFIIDPILNRLPANHEIHGTRDFDSLLGIHENVRVRTFLTVYPVPKLEDTLQRNIHLEYSFMNNLGAHNVQIHRIPNLCIAKWGTHNMLRVMLPGLYRDERKSSVLNQEELATFYEKGLRPAIDSIMPLSASEWPPTYAAEMFRARGHNGQLSFQTKTMADWVVESLGDQLRFHLAANNIPWGEGLVFLHQIRGVKSSTSHRPEQEVAEVALEDFLDMNSLRLEDIEDGHWWIDIGTDIGSVSQHCLAWRTDSHYHVVKNVANIPSQHARRITSLGSSKYQRDMTSHLTAVSGCRISPGRRAEGPFEIKYIQMYTTDKSITYRQDKGHFGKFLTGQDILKGKAVDFCLNLYDLYCAAIDKNYSLARIEVRVPIQYATTALLDLHPTLLQSSLVCFPSVVWWSLRAYRVRAFQYIFEKQAIGDPTLRARDPALLLAAAGPWFLNGLHSTPDNGPSCRDLMGKILPLVDRVGADPASLAYPASTRARPLNNDDVEDDVLEADSDVAEDNISVHSDRSSIDNAPVMEPNPPPHRGRREMLPFNPYGMVFLRAICIGEDYPVPRFNNEDRLMITNKTFRYIFGVDRDDIDIAFFRGTLVQPSNPARIANKVHLTATRVAWHEGEASSVFRLGQRGYALAPPAHDNGSDMDSSGIEEDQESEDSIADEKDIDVVVTRIWRQFLLDLTSKCPNRKHATDPSYCKLSLEERSQVNENTYRNTRLADYFHDCQWKYAGKDDWDKAFDKFWPVKGTQLTGHPQNYTSTKYYLDWGILMSRNDEDTIRAMRRALHTRFNRLKWIPNVQADRIWYTKKDPSFSRLPGSHHSKAAPRVLVKRPSNL